MDSLFSVVVNAVVHFLLTIYGKSQFKFPFEKDRGNMPTVCRHQISYTHWDRAIEPHSQGDDPVCLVPASALRISSTNVESVESRPPAFRFGPGGGTGRRRDSREVRTVINVSRLVVYYRWKVPTKQPTGCSDVGCSVGTFHL